jgi:hypothetical protein
MPHLHDIESSFLTTCDEEPMDTTDAVTTGPSPAPSPSDIPLPPAVLPEVAAAVDLAGDDHEDAMEVVPGVSSPVTGARRSRKQVTPVKHSPTQGAEELQQDLEEPRVAGSSCSSHRRQLDFSQVISHFSYHFTIAYFFRSGNINIFYSTMFLSLH